MTYIVDNPEVEYAFQNDAWKRFGGLFRPLGELLFYLPVFREFYPMVLKTFLDDNVQYLEIRFLIVEVLLYLLYIYEYTHTTTT